MMEAASTAFIMKAFSTRQGFPARMASRAWAKWQECGVAMYTRPISGSSRSSA